MPETSTLNAGQINALFDAVDNQVNGKVDVRHRERWIFEQVYGETSEALERMWTFMKNVTTCPPEVIAFCQKILAPKEIPKAAE